MHRFQISVFGAVAIVFAVIGVNEGIFSDRGALNAMSAGWLILAIVDILWVLFFTAEEDSLCLHLFNSMGTGGLTPPSRRRRTRTQSSMHGVQPNNGYTTNYSSGGGIGPETYDTKMGMGLGGGAFQQGGAVRSQASFADSLSGANRSVGGTGPGSVHNPASGTGSIGGADGPHSPLMAGIGAGGSANNSGSDPNPLPEMNSYSYRAKALYACTFLAYSSPVSLCLTLNYSRCCKS